MPLPSKNMLLTVLPTAAVAKVTVSPLKALTSLAQLLLGSIGIPTGVFLEALK